MKALILSAALISGATFAQGRGDERAETKTREGEGDVTQVICRAETEVGSRLGRRRICRTRAEWAEHRSQYKQVVERAQREMQTSYTDPDE